MNESEKYLVMTSETPPRFLKIIEHGDKDSGGRPDRRELVLISDLNDASTTPERESASKLHDIACILYPRVRLHVNEAHSIEAVSDE